MEHSGMVIDTSIFIEFLRAKDKTKTTLFQIPDNQPVFISSVTLFELLMGAKTNEKITDIQLLTEDLTVLDFHKVVAEKAAMIYHQLRSENKMIEFRDIFIAATCMINHLSLLTLNKRDFKRISELQLI
jgi:predicted nucleic acid-binding protein